MNIAIFPKQAPVRILRTEDHWRLPVIPIVDIARAIGIDRRYFHNLINRNKDVFDGWFVIVTMTNPSSKGGRPNLVCLTKEGIIGSLVKISVDRIKDLAIRTRIIEFQRWAIHTITAVLDGRLPKDFTLSLEEAISLPQGCLRGDVMRQYQQKKGISRATGYRHLQIARMQAGFEPSLRKTRSDKGSHKKPCCLKKPL